MTEHTKTPMPSERAVVVAGRIADLLFKIEVSGVNLLRIIDEITKIISSEYADLEAWAEYVERVVLCDRAQSGETMPSFLSLGELLTCPEWKKDKRK